MARIRSVHPGLFTDEAFVSLSFPSRMLVIGLWTECDDHGIFEWKPLTLKMRLMAADNVNVADLLGEIERAAPGIIVRFTVDGREYGAVRNFCKYQRPKKPNYKHKLPKVLETYVGLSSDGGEPVPHQEGAGGEKSPQREEEGDNRRGGGEDARAREPDSGSGKKKIVLTPWSPEWIEPPEWFWAFGRSVGLTDSEIAKAFGKWRRHARRKAVTEADWVAAGEEWLTGDADRLGRSGDAPETPAPLIELHRGTPEFLAWEGHFVATKQTVQLDHLRQCREANKPIFVRSQWPPGHVEQLGLPMLASVAGGKA